MACLDLCVAGMIIDFFQLLCGCVNTADKLAGVINAGFLLWHGAQALSAGLQHKLPVGASFATGMYCVLGIGCMLTALRIVLAHGAPDMFRSMNTLSWCTDPTLPPCSRFMWRLQVCGRSVLLFHGKTHGKHDHTVCLRADLCTRMFNLSIGEWGCFDTTKSSRCALELREGLWYGCKPFQNLSLDTAPWKTQMPQIRQSRYQNVGSTSPYSTDDAAVTAIMTLCLFQPRTLTMCC
jgi:hypothetical protein